MHLASAFFATVHATVATVYAEALQKSYGVPVHSVWPPVLWSDAFKRPLDDLKVAVQRDRWLESFGFAPKARNAFETSPFGPFLVIK